MEKEKESVDGIILVLSCQKHSNTRLKEFKVPKPKLSIWKTIYVIGDFFLNKNYKLEDDRLTIKCEDSYIHLLKKLVLSIKYLNEIYKIKIGILRSGDDLLFNEQELEDFLKNSYKPDFYGFSPANTSLINPNAQDLKNTKDDYFMLSYYFQHQEDFKNPHHNLNNVDLIKYVKRPRIDIGVSGVLYYISNKCCNILVNHMENINFNVFHFDEFSNSYPYTIEDCAVSFILYYNKVDFIHSNIFKNVIAFHTNKYK
jgi:hypothetical protein